MSFTWSVTHAVPFNAGIPGVFMQITKVAAITLHSYNTYHHLWRKWTSSHVRMVTLTLQNPTSERERGGEMSAESAGSLPRNRQQAYIECRQAPETTGSPLQLDTGKSEFGAQ